MADSRIDPYAPAEMAGRAQTVGVAKGRLDAVSLLTLAVLAGAFIAVGAELATVVSTASTLGAGPTRLLVGVAFSVGLILVVIAGAELFTGNTLIVMAWLSRKVTTGQLLRNWVLAYAGNFLGALATVALVYATGQWATSDHAIGASALLIADAKVQLPFWEAFTRGVLGNALVNLAVWLCFSARSNVDKIFAIVPPIAAFVASGFEHSIANMYFVPMGLLLRDNAMVVQAAGVDPGTLDRLSWQGFLQGNLLPVTLGNTVGGALLVAAVYWLVYLRPAPTETQRAESRRSS